MNVSRSRTVLFASVLAAMVLVATLAMAELWARFWVLPHKKFHAAYQPAANARIHTFDPRLGWVGLPAIDLPFSAVRTVRVRHNTEGFRDHEHAAALTRPRWVFLGDSFTWGYDVEAAERFTDLISAVRPDVEVVNAGVSGYGTSQQSLLYTQRLKRHRAELVVLLFGANDRADNQKSVSDAGYAVPRFLVRDSRPVLESSELPCLIDESNEARPRLVWYRSHLWDHLRYRVHRLRRHFETDPTEYILTQLHDSVRSDGGRLVVAIEKRDAAVVAWSSRLGVPVVELGSYIEEGATRQATHFRGFGDHWTPWGHRLAAEALRGLLDKVQPPTDSRLPQSHGNEGATRH